MALEYTFVVIGGGISGVSCAETLALLNENTNILLITKSEIVKTVSSAVHITKTIVEINVEEASAKVIRHKFPNIEILTESVTRLNHSERIVETENHKIKFNKLCICTGARANLIDENNPFIIGIRDTESVNEFEKRIKESKRIMVVGNGGIASEIMYEVKGVDKVWVIKDSHITKTFIDAGAGEFFKDQLEKESTTCQTVIKRLTYTTLSESVENKCCKIKNPALGPDWHKHFNLTGSVENNQIKTEFNCEVHKIMPGDEKWPIYVELTNNQVYGVDFVVSATGVIPNSGIFTSDDNSLKLSQDGGIIVNEKMETSLKDVFAAGDVCSAGWEWALHWHQMRLWIQAQQMGCYSAKCMTASLKGEDILQDFCFELFTHVTKLYGYKVILLGLFNGQKLNNEYEILLRMTKGKEYIKLVLKDGRLQGAMLIGDTDLEEMCENLILNQLDLTPYGEDILNPDIDIEDYFD